MRRPRIAIAAILIAAVPLTEASPHQWSDVLHGTVHADGLEYFDFLVREDVVSVTVGLKRLPGSDNYRGGSALELFLRYESFPTETTHDQSYQLSATSSSASLSIDDLRAGRYYVSVLGSLLFDSAPSFVGSRTEFQYLLNVTYTACRTGSDFSVELQKATNDTTAASVCAIMSTMQAIEPPVSSSGLALDSYYKVANNAHQGCVDVLRSALWYTFEIQKPKWDLSITLSTTFAAGFDMVVFAGSHNLTEIPAPSINDADARLQSTSIPRGAGFRSISLRFTAPQTGRWTVMIVGNLTDNSTCSTNGGSSFNLQTRHNDFNCTADNSGSVPNPETTVMPAIPIIASMIDPCAFDFVELKQTRRFPEKPEELLDASFDQDEMVTRDFNASKRFFTGYHAGIDPRFAGAFIQLRVQATRNIPSFQVFARVDAFPTLSLFDYRFTSSEASALASSRAVNATTNTSFDMQEYSWAPIRYPKPGLWWLILVADEATNSNELNPIAAVNVSLRTFACPEGACSAHGKCQIELSSSGKSFSACSCDYGFGGGQCESVAVDRTYRGTQIFFVIASNLAALPSLWLCSQRKLYAETVVFLATSVISFLYHACDYDFFCVLDFSELHHMDFALSLSVVSVVVVHLSGARNDLKAGLLVFYLLSAILITNAEGSAALYAWISFGGVLTIQFAMAISYYAVVGASRMGLGKGLALKAFLLHSKNFDRRYGVVGLVFLAVAVTCLFTSSSSNYWILHTVWHISFMMAVFCFIAVRKNDRYQLFAPDFCVDVLATPPQFRFAVSSVKSIDILEEDTSENDRPYNVRSWR